MFFLSHVITNFGGSQGLFLKQNQHDPGVNATVKKTVKTFQRTSSQWTVMLRIALQISRRRAYVDYFCFAQEGGGQLCTVVELRFGLRTIWRQQKKNTVSLSFEPATSTGLLPRRYKAINDHTLELENV